MERWQNEQHVQDATRIRFKFCLRRCLSSSLSFRFCTGKRDLSSVDMNFQPAPQQWPGQEVVDGAQCFEAPQQPSHEAPIHHQQQQQAQASHAQDQEGSGSDGDDDDGDDDDFDPELATWLARTLQRRQPGAELTVGSVKVLSRLLDELTARVLAEAQRVSTTGGGGADASGSDVVAVVAAAAQAAPAPQSAQGQEQHQETQQQQQTLTSRDISKVRRAPAAAALNPTSQHATHRLPPPRCTCRP